LDALWALYQARFAGEDGRIIDRDNGDVTHSEGQGYGMLLAAAAGDWPGFDRIWNWTRTRLGRRDFPLFAWKWSQRSERVEDWNNATDGDILIAWALARAGRARDRDDLRLAALQTALAVRARLTMRIAGAPALLPGLKGFVFPGRVSLNLSYYVFPAFQEFASLDGSDGWNALAEAGRGLARRARFGAASLPPDWLDMAPDGHVTPAKDRPARFGFDAVRVPLHLAWAGMTAPEDLDVYRQAWTAEGNLRPPAWRALDGGDDARYPASSGVMAFADLVAGRRPATATLWSAVGDEGYYAASLALLALTAADERGLREIAGEQDGG